MLITIPAYHVHTMDPIPFCIDTEAPISCIGNKVLQRIISPSGRKSIPFIVSDRDFQFRDTVIKSKFKVRLFLPTPEHVRRIPILLDEVNVNVPFL